MVSSIGSSGSGALQNIQQRQSSFFSKTDGGSAGLSVDEFSAMVANTPADGPNFADTPSNFSRIGANGDGSLSADESQSAPQSLIDPSQSTLSKFGGIAPPNDTQPADAARSSTATDSATGAGDVLSQLLSALSGSDGGT